MARWLWCFGQPNVVRQSPSQDDSTGAKKQQNNKRQAARAVALQAASSRADRHVAFDASGGQNAQEAVAAATDTSAALSQQLMAALKANRDMRVSTEPLGSIHTSTTGYNWSSTGFAAGPISPKVPDEDPIQRAVLQDPSDDTSQLPVISHTSLDTAFNRSMQAIAVVRVASHIPLEQRSSDTGVMPAASAAGDDVQLGRRSSRAGSVRVSMVCSDDGSGIPAEEQPLPPPQQQQQQYPQQQTAAAIAAKLEPVYLNRSVQQMLDCRDHEEYTFTMDKQLARNPMLAMLFENCVQRLLAGKVTSVRQYTPLFSSPNSVHPTAQAKLVNLQINTCVFQDDSGNTRPALFLWYNAPSSQFDLTSQLKRNYMALASVPSMVSVIAMDGRVLQQNSSSVAYMGFAMGSNIEGTHLGDPCHTLQRLFVLDPDALDEMLTTLQEGKSWQGQLRMPPQLDLTEPCEPSQPDEDILWEPSEHNNQDNSQSNNQINSSGDGNNNVNNDSNRFSDSSALSGDVSEPLVGSSSPPATAAVAAAPAAAAAGTAHLPGAVDSVPSSRRGTTDQGNVAAPAAAAGSRSNKIVLPAADSMQHSSSSGGDHTSVIAAAAAAGPKISSSSSAANGAVKPMLSGAQVSISGGSSSSISLPSAFAAGLREGSRSLSSQMVKNRAMQMLFGVDTKKPWRHGYRISAGSTATSRRPSTAGCSEPRNTWSGSSSTERWHRVQASKFSDPVTGEDVILLISTDVTQRVAAEKQLQQVLNAEHKLLEGIFPKQVLQALTKSAIRNHIQTCAGGNLAGSDGHTSAYQGINAGKIRLALKHEQVSIMFADIVGFTSMSKEVEPSVVMEFLNDLYTRFDDLLEDAGVYKVETIGDCYMVAGGLIFTDAHGFKTVLQSEVDPLHAHRAFTFAVAMLKAAQGLTLPGSGEPVKMRVGIHSGPCVSGVVGSRMPRFCLFGDSVNTASRMESSNKKPGTIHVSDVTRELIGGDFWQDAGQEEIKGKGLMATYYFNPGITSDGSSLAAVIQKVRAVTCTPDKEGNLFCTMTAH